MTRVALLRRALARAIEAERVLRICAEEMETTIEALVMPGKGRRASHDRFVAMAVMHAAGVSPSEIGKEFARDRTTVINGLQQVDERTELAERVRVIKAKLGIPHERGRGKPALALRQVYEAPRLDLGTLESEAA